MVNRGYETSSSEALSSPTDSLPPPYSYTSPPYVYSSYDAGADTQPHITHDEKNKQPLAKRLVRSLTESSVFAAQRVGPSLSWTAQTSSQFWQDRASPLLRKIPFPTRQIVAFIILMISGLAPLVAILAQRDHRGRMTFIDAAFGKKVLGCGTGVFGEPQNATVVGTEAVFVLDAAFGRFTFSQVKTMDVAWDILVGRGVQLLAWLASYAVFSDSLLRLIERHDASFQTFKCITLEGASLMTAWRLVTQLFGRKSKRTWALFCYMLVSTLYILAIPALLSAMTGYDSRTIPFVSVGKDDNIVPASYFKYGYMVMKVGNSTLDPPTCEAAEQLDQWSTIKSSLRTGCSCQSPDGKIQSSADWSRLTYGPGGGWANYKGWSYDDCNYNYTGQVDTVKVWKDGIQNCNQSRQITIQDTQHDIHDLTTQYGYCWNNQGFTYQKVGTINTRCLPDTAHPSYQWGFSTTLVALFCFLQSIWTVSMYALWQDAQWNSELVASGIRITELRGAFALTEAARRATGFGGEALVRGEERESKEKKKKKGWSGVGVGVDIFRDERLEARRRRGIMEERGA